MGIAILELLVVLALFVGVFGGLVALVIRFTSFGQWCARKVHKFSLDSNRTYDCPVGHGSFGPAEVIEIDGVGLCPACYRAGITQRLWKIKKKTTHAKF